MRQPTEIQIFDQGYEVIHSQTYIYHGQGLTVGMLGWTFNFNFYVDSQDLSIRYNVTFEGTSVRIDTYNFVGALPAGTASPRHILENVRFPGALATDPVKDIFFALRTEPRLGHNGPGTATITFYSRIRSA